MSFIKIKTVYYSASVDEYDTACAQTTYINMDQITRIAYHSTYYRKKYYMVELSSGEAIFCNEEEAKKIFDGIGMTLDE